jgi:hypothetical protein
MGVYVRSVAVFSNLYGKISLAGWGILKWPQVGYFGWPSGGLDFVGPFEFFTALYG